MRILSLILISLSLVLPLQAAGTPEPVQNPVPQVGDPAPDWNLQDPSGKEHKLSDYQGKIVLLDFWATWCGPCKKGMPGIQALHEEYGDRIQIFGMVFWDDVESAAAYMKEMEYTYTILLEADQLETVYGIEAIPRYYLIGPDGRIIYRQEGWAQFVDEEIKEIIAKELAPKET